MNVLKMLTSGSAAPRTVTYIGSTESTADLSTYTFTGVNLGTPSAGRLVVIGIVAHNVTSARNINTVTVAGSSATSVTSQTSQLLCTGLYQIVNTTDSTANIVVAFSGAQLRCAITVWNITNINSTTRQAANSFSSGSANTGYADTLTGTAGGVAVAISGIGANGRTATWSATAGSVTEDNDVSVETAISYSSSHVDNLGNTAPNRITCTWTSTASVFAVSAARWY